MYPLPSSSTIPLSTTFHSPQAETQMEAALKTSFRKEMATKFIPQAFIEELSGGLNGQNDDFSVDDLLDFSHVEEEEPEQQQQQKVEEDSACVSLENEKQSHEICKPATSNEPLKDDYASVPSGELIVPVDDVADLEWLSHFVEDSFLEFSSAAAFPTVGLTENPKKEPKPGQENPVFTEPCFKTPVQTKARSKRTRTGVRVWPRGSPSLTDSSSSTTTTTTTSSSSSSPSSPLLICTTNFPFEQFCSEAARPPPPAKKPKRNPSSEGGTPRRCSHCGVQKTPQWRAGPLGAKTLCNACGVRFKSGRLLPEYRPACSPTFSSQLHSNHHRKVLEMRRKKETETDDDVMTGLAPVTPVIPNF